MSWFWDNFGGVITTVIAIYGAFLSSLNFWYMWKRDRKKLYIKAIYNPSNNVNYNNVEITVISGTRRPIIIEDVGLKYPTSFEPKISKIINVYYDPAISELPKKLEIGEKYSCSFLCSYYDDKNEKCYSVDVSAVPYAIDTEGQQYVGEPLKHQVFFIPCSKSDTDKDNKSEHQKD